MDSPNQKKQLIELRDEALAHLDGAPSEVDFKSGLKQVEAMFADAPKNRSVESYEAQIALIVAIGRRPRSAQKSLYRLFQARLAEKQGAEFAEFQGHLKDAGGNGFSLQGLSFFESFATLDHEQVWADTGAAIAHVKSLVGEAFLNSGTLLGAVREKAFIAHDDDVDIAVILKATNATDAAKEWISVYQLLQSKKLIKKPPSRNFGVFKMKSVSGINIDVFPAWIEDDRMFIYPHTAGDLGVEDVLPLAACETTGLPIPKDAEAMLAVNYGEGWRTPDPNFAFPWAKANRRFATFRSTLEADETAWVIK